MSIHQAFTELQTYLNQCIIGQEDLTQKMIITLLCDGHLLVEGTPGLAKTKAVKVLSDAILTRHHRIQFTPDLLPADITGSDVYRYEANQFHFQKGPIFNNIVLADEINRAPAKVQSALLEAMGERQVTIGNKTYQLPDLFMVMATQNPIEQEGTYPLPEAQLDRFLLYVKIKYPNATAERQILNLINKEEKNESLPTFYGLDEKQIFTARDEVANIYIAPELQEYIIQLIMATREPAVYSEELAGLIAYGVSPRGTIAMDIAARASAWLNGRDFVAIEDVQSVIFDVLRHRIILSFEAKAKNITADDIIKMIISKVPMV